MTHVQLTRRNFLTDSSRAAAAGWLALQLPWLAGLGGCATEDDRGGDSFAQLTPAEARAMQAFAAQIIPSGDGDPGAVEAGAVQFVDRALAMPFFATSVPVVRAGLADLDARAAALGSSGGFASLTSGQQIAVMRRIEKEPFFATARMLVLAGTFAEPSYGGNKDGAGWALVGMEHRPSYTTPFGWYDAQPGADAERRGG